MGNEAISFEIVFPQITFRVARGHSERSFIRSWVFAANYIVFALWVQRLELSMLKNFGTFGKILDVFPYKLSHEVIAFALIATTTIFVFCLLILINKLRRRNKKILSLFPYREIARPSQQKE
jgi:hypothetical protein